MVGPNGLHGHHAVLNVSSIDGEPVPIQNQPKEVYIVKESIFKVKIALTDFVKVCKILEIIHYPAILKMLIRKVNLNENDTKCGLFLND